MEARERIRTAFERRVTALERMPSVGQGTAVTRVRLHDGLVCDVEDGAWKLTVDASAKSGGMGLGPDPGVYGRSALGACMAISYGYWSVWRGVAFDRVEVEVQADYDARGNFGVGDERPEYRQVRCIVTVESRAPRAAVLQVLDEADAHCPYLQIFRRPVDVRREVRFAGEE